MNDSYEEFKQAEKLASMKEVSPATEQEQRYLDQFPKDERAYKLEELRLAKFEKKLARVKKKAGKGKSNFTKSNKLLSKNKKKIIKKSKKQNRR